MVKINTLLLGLFQGNLRKFGANWNMSRNTRFLCYFFAKIFIRAILYAFSISAEFRASNYLPPTIQISRFAVPQSSWSYFFFYFPAQASKCFRPLWALWSILCPIYPKDNDNQSKLDLGVEDPFNALQRILCVSFRTICDLATINVSECRCILPVELSRVSLFG